MTPQGKIDKGWGYEIVWANNDKYCGKILVFEKAGAKTSLVLHKEKSKSWFVNAGKFKLTFIDPATWHNTSKCARRRQDLRYRRTQRTSIRSTRAQFNDIRSGQY
jgi:hypothetical protein